MTVQLSTRSTRIPVQTTRYSSWRLPLAVLGAAFAVGLAVVLCGFPFPVVRRSSFDPYCFGAMGKSIVQGDGFAPYGALIQRRAPLYPLMIAGLYALFGEQPLTVYIAQALLLAGTCVLVFDIGRRMFNVRTGLIAAALVGLNPMLLRYVGDLQLESLLTFLLTLTVWLSVRFYARPTVLNGVLVGAAAGLASLTKSVALPWPFLLAAIVIGATFAAPSASAAVRLPWLRSSRCSPACSSSSRPGRSATTSPPVATSSCCHLAPATRSCAATSSASPSMRRCACRRTNTPRTKATSGSDL